MTLKKIKSLTISKKPTMEDRTSTLIKRKKKEDLNMTIVYFKDEQFKTS